MLSPLTQAEFVETIEPPSPARGEGTIRIAALAVVKGVKDGFA
jgi:hypothetical protein